MKEFLIGLILFILVSNIKAQDTILLDRLGKITMPGFDSFYRVCMLDHSTRKPIGRFNDYYSDTKELYSSGEYCDGKRCGKTYVYDNLSHISYTLSYIDNEIDTVSIYDSTGKYIRIQYQERNGNYIIYKWKDNLLLPFINKGNGYINSTMRGYTIKGKVKDNLPTGAWIIASEDVVLREKFSKGVFVEGEAKLNNGGNEKTNESYLKYLLADIEYFDNSEQLLKSNYYRKRDYPLLDTFFTPRYYLPDEPVSGFFIVEEHAKFPGGIKNLNQYIQLMLAYPEVSRKMDIKGTVKVKFTVGTDGEISDPIIIEGLDNWCNKEALRIVKEMPDWIPGRQRTRLVSESFIIPIHFQ